jgi:hypothetical protein
MGRQLHCRLKRAPGVSAFPAGTTPKVDFEYIDRKRRANDSRVLVGSPASLASLDIFPFSAPVWQVSPMRVDSSLRRFGLSLSLSLSLCVSVAVSIPATTGSLRAAETLPGPERIAGMTLADCVEQLGSEVRPERLRAIRTLGLFDQAAAEPLAEALSHSDPAVRFLAATQLGRIGGKALQSNVAELAKRVGDPDDQRIERQQNPDSGDPSPSVRVAAAYALCEAGQTDVYLTVILDALDHPDRGMCCYAADLIGRLGGDARAALPKLQQVHAANKPGVRGGDYHRGGAAMNAIRKIRGE